MAVPVAAMGENALPCSGAGDAGTSGTAPDTVAGLRLRIPAFVASGPGDALPASMSNTGTDLTERLRSSACADEEDDARLRPIAAADAADDVTAAGPSGAAKGTPQEAVEQDDDPCASFSLRPPAPWLKLPTRACAPVWAAAVNGDAEMLLMCEVLTKLTSAPRKESC